MADHGSLEVILGPMFSGKTTELIRRVDEARMAGDIALLFKPATDDRHGRRTVSTHDGVARTGVSVETDLESIRDLQIQVGVSELSRTAVLGFDEVNFFSANFPRLCAELILQGKRVIAAGLDYDFARRPFGPTLRLAGMATAVAELTAVCEICKRAASAYQRIIGGNPAPIDGPLVMVGGEELYRPRCIECYSRERRESTQPTP